MDYLLLVLPTDQYPSYLPVARRRRLPVLVEAPAGCDIAVAAELAHMFEDPGVRLQVLLPWRHMMTTACLARSLAGIGAIVAVHAEYVWPIDRVPLWRGDSLQAGNGVLAHLGYHLFDLLVATLGLPERVFSWTRRLPPRLLKMPHDVEDTASVQLAYADGFEATLFLTWAGGPEQCSLTFRGTEGTIQWSPSECWLASPDGTVIEQARHQGTLVDLQTAGYAQAIENAVAPPDDEPPADPRRQDDRSQQIYPRIDESAMDQLQVMLLLEAARLSSRTGQWESVSGVSRLHGVRVDT